MKPERPSLLTYASSDGDVDWDKYRPAMVDFLMTQEGDGEWEDWPEDKAEEKP